ncbi:MAG: hypothetical protein EP338_06910 [Bacteroidetes bacterium]|nr:MAG: hypothetical protein EP338_06910 [Bacteroidota bacterium]
MEAINDHILGLKISIEKLMQGKFWLYLIPALVIGILYYASASYMEQYEENTWFASVPWIGSYLNKGAVAVMGFASYLLFMFYKFLVLTALSPVNCLLSEKLDNELTGAKFSGGFVRIITDLLRAVFILVVALFLNFMIMGIWWLFAWITGFHAIDSLIYWLINSFFLGFAFYDYSLERYGEAIFSSFGFGFGRMLHVLLTGALFNLIYLIPYAGILLAPFLVTMVSTVVYLKTKGKLTQTKAEVL